VGDTGVSVGLEHYGASAPYQVVFEKFGFTTDRVVAAARSALGKTDAAQRGNIEARNERGADRA
jgi:transketolase